MSNGVIFVRGLFRSPRLRPALARVIMIRIFGSGN